MIKGIPETEACVMRDASESESAGSHRTLQCVFLSVSAEVAPVTTPAIAYLLAVELVTLSRACNTDSRI